MYRSVSFLSFLFSIILLNSCIISEEYNIEEPGDAVVSLTIEKSFGENEAQTVKAIFKNEVGEISELKDGIIKFNGVKLDWVSTTKAYYIDANYIIPEDNLNIFELTFPNGEIVSSEIKTPLYIEDVEIPIEINLNNNNEIKWEGGSPSENVIVIVWTRPLEMESWEILVNEETPDDGSYMLLASSFESYMGEWQIAIELIRGIQGDPDPLYRDGSELYSLFVFGQYSGKIVNN